MIGMLTADDLKLLLCGLSELNFLQLKEGAVYEEYTGKQALIDPSTSGGGVA